MAPYNVPRNHLLQQMEEAKLTGKNCWNCGITLKGYYFPCGLLPPFLFTPFISYSVLHSENRGTLQIPLLPTEYEDVFVRLLYKECSL